MNSMGLLLAFLLIMGAVFALCVMLIRWALRVNDIVQRLDKIVEILNAK
jgi:hypothetical protein